MKATVGLHDLRVECIIGIHPHERDAPQPIRVDVELDTDVTAAVASQAIEDAVDYEIVAAIIREQAARAPRLLEALAHHTALALLERFPAVTRVQLEIRKPNALEAAADSFVRVERRQ